MFPPLYKPGLTGLCGCTAVIAKCCMLCLTSSHSIWSTKCPSCPSLCISLRPKPHLNNTTPRTSPHPVAVPAVHSSHRQVNGLLSGVRKCMGLNLYWSDTKHSSTHKHVLRRDLRREDGRLLCWVRCEFGAQHTITAQGGNNNKQAAN